MTNITINELVKEVKGLPSRVQRFYNDLRFEELTPLLEFENKLKKAGFVRFQDNDSVDEPWFEFPIGYEDCLQIGIYSNRLSLINGRTSHCWDIAIGQIRNLEHVDIGVSKEFITITYTTVDCDFLTMSEVVKVKL